jgi:Rha family phage regulatory protein
MLLASSHFKSKSNPRRRNTMTKNLTPATITDLVVIENDKPMTTSLKVAEVFGKNHKDVLKAIQNLECSEDFIERNFALNEYEVKVGFGTRLAPMYCMTRDGFSFLAMGFTGSRAAEFKERYIAEFNRMEAALRERQEPQPMSPIEMLELQIKVLKEVERKSEEAATEARGAASLANEAANRVLAIEHKIDTNGCAPGFIPMRLAHQRYGRELSRAMFDRVVDWLGVQKQSYCYTIPETGQLHWSTSVQEEGLSWMLDEFIEDCVKVTDCFYVHPAFGNKRFMLTVGK